MKKQQMQERIIKFFTEGLKFQEVPSKSTKYRAFQGKEGNNLYFIGRKGAIRVGECASKSVSMTTHIQQGMRAWEMKGGRNGND